MSIDEFRDEDELYKRWLSAHNRGYVINIQRSLNSSDARLHKADCSTITGEPARGRTSTGPYIKVCSPTLGELDRWARTNVVGSAIQPCGRCKPPGYRSATVGGGGPPRWTPSPPHHRDVPAIGAHDVRYELRGPGTGSREVWLRGEHYIPFDRLTPAQLVARNELRERLRSLVAGPGEILHATYGGFKRPDTDVENLLLYNIDTGGACFLPSAQLGIRFELAGNLRLGPIFKGGTCSYQYRLIPADTKLVYWRRRLRIARFEEVHLGRFGTEGRLAQTWLAVHRAKAEVADQSITPDTPFGVFLQLSIPGGTRLGLRPELVKSLIDGVVCALQAQRDPASIDEIAARLSSVIREAPSRIAERLLDQERAVLGIVNRLIHLRGVGVQWNPSDHMCVVGEVLRGEAPGKDWRLSGEVWTLEALETCSTNRS